MKNLVVGLVAGLFAGVAFVVACGQAGVRRANASPSDCTSWQFVDSSSVSQGVTVPVSGGGSFSAIQLAAGWEPFGVVNGDVYVRRCTP
jgi:hypothetical protein